ncbi:hypothetical protein MRX96_034845 [Rhipicephalus microplus]
MEASATQPATSQPQNVEGQLQDIVTQLRLLFAELGNLKKYVDDTIKGVKKTKETVSPPRCRILRTATPCNWALMETLRKPSLYKRPYAAIRDKYKWSKPGDHTLVAYDGKKGDYICLQTRFSVPQFDARNNVTSKNQLQV